MTLTDEEWEFIDFCRSILKFFRYLKSVIFISIYSFLSGYIFIDVLGFSYLKFWLIFAPMNLVAKYFIFDRVFKKR